MAIRSFEAGFKRRLVEATKTGLMEVEQAALAKLKAVVGTHNPTHKSGVKYKRPRQSGMKTHTTFDHGAPFGGPPWTRTTMGQQAIASELLDDGMRLRLGVLSNAIYMLYLDQGINYSQVGERSWPWANVTIEAMLPELRQLFMAGAR